MQIEKSKLCAEHEEELLQTEAKHKANIKSINKRHAARQELMKESLKKTNWELSQVTDMSMHVAEECIQLKKSRENESKLRESLDSTTESFEVQLAKAHAEIGVLTEMLADSNNEVEDLQEALVKAREELAVSVAFLINYNYNVHALTPLLYVTTETKTTCYSKEGRSMG